MALDYSNATDKVIGYLGGMKGSPAQQAKGREFIEAIVKGIYEDIEENAVVSTVDSAGDTCNDGTIE